MKIDIIDVLSDAGETVFGRIILTSLAIIISGAVGLLVGDFDDVGIIDALLAVVPLLFISLLGGIGLITLPLLFGFTIMFVRFDWSYIWLCVPAAMSFYTMLQMVA